MSDAKKVEAEAKVADAPKASPARKQIVGWIIYRADEETLADQYETQKFIKEAKAAGLVLKIYKPEHIDLILTTTDRNTILIDGAPSALPDFVLPRMGASTTYYALAVIRHLERLGVKCINSSTSIEAVKDKLYSHQILAESNIPVPKTMLAKLPMNSTFVAEHFGFPVVIKTLSGSQGKGVFLANNKKEFVNLMDMVQVSNHNVNLIVQQMMQDSNGRDLRVFVVGGRVVACMQRTAPPDEFKANVHAGGSVKEFEVTPEIEWLSTEACKILGLEIGGVDLLFDHGHFKICEVNSSPGFKGIETACPNANIAAEIFDYIKVRFGLFDLLEPQKRKGKSS